MNIIALEKENEVLKYLSVDDLPENLPDTSFARCEQQKGLEVFRKTMQMQTIESLKDCEFHKIYENSFSRCRSKWFNEPSRVSLTSKKRIK